MKKILFISTGGTFNKHYQESTGDICIDMEASTLMELAQKWRTEFEILNIIGKDSLDMSDADRVLLLSTIRNAKEDNIIVIHGTDTMDKSATVIAEANLSKKIILTGAMVPYRVDKVEATANVAMAYGYLQHNLADGVYISMNATIGRYDKVVKNRNIGKFESI